MDAMGSDHFSQEIKNVASQLGGDDIEAAKLRNIDLKFDPYSDSADEDYESLDETADEWNDQGSDVAAPSRLERDAIAEEIEELRHFKTLATNIRDNAKGKALFTALDRAFAELDRLGAPRKAIIFTESKRTQEYLLNLLADTPYGDGIVLFNGTNSDQRAQAIYKDWLKRHEGTDRITGSKTADNVGI